MTLAQTAPAAPAEAASSVAGLSVVTRQGHPDFLDLPWGRPLAEWGDHTERLVELRRGRSRHIVRMVRYGERVYALKETRPRLAQHEHRLLRHLEEERLPAVRPIGVVTGRHDGGGTELDSVLITRYLDFSLPYQHVFRTVSAPRLCDRLLDAAVVLLSRLHLEGVYWGDMSLANLLFRRDAGALMAYLVDAETTEHHPQLSDAMRSHDVELGAENIAAGLLDAQSAGWLDDQIDPLEIGRELVDRYRRLWAELTHEEIVSADERWRINARIERLNELGFDVEELEIVRSADGTRLRIRPVVVEEGHAHLRLRRLTGLEVQENQARTLLNALDAYGLVLERESGRPLPEAVKAYRWLAERYEPVIEAIPERYRDRLDDAQMIYEFIQHRYERSKAAGRQVDNEEALVTFVADVLETLPDERLLPAGAAHGAHGPSSSTPKLR
ncbi:DUF4032 domain-containing protein [Candidatus Poriferisodalis sp.]|uniref:DUF4032 domain-containing protein n=1 Tax=Candidatus Poriferisodalis sp. TaxID=3101277 RepID=UPI003B0116B2